MQYLELRRHSRRIGPEEHLSQDGVTLARRTGEHMGPFHWVLTSEAIRTWETAVAMGFACQEQYEVAKITAEEEQWKALDKLMPEGTSFAVRARQMQNNPLGRRFAQELRDCWKRLAERLPDGATALVITHGGYIDCSAVACLPDADHQSWGPNFGHCEGIRLSHDGSDFRSGTLLRV